MSERVPDDILALIAASGAMAQSPTFYQAVWMARELIELRRQCAQVQRRYQWAANELLACDYGDNLKGDAIGWVVYGWRDKNAGFSERRRIYGSSIDVAIDSELP